MKSVFPKPIFLGAATRTPIGKFGGSLKRFSAAQLATLALKEAIHRAPSASPADFVLMGHARQAGGGPNTARQASLAAGLAESLPAMTLNQACASGMASIIAGAEKIALGRASSVWAGGVESMSNTPYLLLNARWGIRMGNGEVTDGMHKDGFFCPMAKMLMGETVEKFLATELKIHRKDQDDYAFESQKRANAAWASHQFSAETFVIPAEGKHSSLSHDEHLRPDTTRESLDKLSPVFDPIHGSITAANSSGITDGAAWVHLSSDRLQHSQVQILDYETVALDPRRMGLGPVDSIQRMLSRQNLTVKDIDIFEINEAFAAQVLACNQSLHIPDLKLNPLGGSIAIGHPIGCTGTRISVTLTHQLKGQPGKLGVASLCVSGGMGVSLLLQGI